MEGGRSTGEETVGEGGGKCKGEGRREGELAGARADRVAVAGVAGVDAIVVIVVAVGGVGECLEGEDVTGDRTITGVSSGASDDGCWEGLWDQRRRCGKRRENIKVGLQQHQNQKNVKKNARDRTEKTIPRLQPKQKTIKTSNQQKPSYPFHYKVAIVTPASR